jgi:hypothetical protein
MGILLEHLSARSSDNYDPTWKTFAKGGDETLLIHHVFDYLGTNEHVICRKSVGF